MNEANFGQRVEQLMIASGANTADLCRATGASKERFYAWKNKGTTPNALTALKIAKYFGTTVEYLITGKTENPLQDSVNAMREKLKKINDITKTL